MDFDTFFISPEEVGVRLDKLLSTRFQEKSRTYFQYLIENGLVLVNNNAVKKRETLQEGDEVEVCFQLTPELSLEPENIPLEILYEDDHLLAINKPAGMVVHPAPGHWRGTFVNALLGHCKRSALPEEGVRPGIVHRLDKETTGVLLAAKTPLCHQRLIQLFQEKKIKKEYIAVTLGKPTSGICQEPIGRHPSKRKEMAIVENGKEATTEFKLLAWSGKYSLVLAYPVTGRTHQIRVHLKHLSAPVVGDSIYGHETEGVERQLLHARKISFIHPITKQPLEIVAPLPSDLKNFLALIFPNI